MIVIRLFLWLTITVTFASPILAWYGLEHTALAAEGPNSSVSDINAAKKFLQKFDPRNLPDGESTTIRANQHHINNALAAALAAAPFLKARIVTSRFGLLGAVTVFPPIPDNPFGKYLNIRMLIESSNEGLQIGRLSVGDIELPTAIFLPLLTLVMDKLAGVGSGEALLESIRSVEVSRSQVVIVFRPKGGLLDDRKT